MSRLLHPSCSLLFILIICLSSTVNGQKASIHFQLAGLENQELIAGYYWQNKQYALDTINLDKAGQGTWNNRKLDEGLYFFVIPGNRYFDLLIGKDQSLTVTADIRNLLGTMKISDSCETSLYLSYQKGAQHIQDIYKHYELLVDNSLPDSTEIFRKRMKETRVSLELLKDSFIRQYPHSLTAGVIRMLKNDIPQWQPKGMTTTSLRYLYYRTISHFLDGIDLSDARLLHTPYPAEKLDMYFNRMIPQSNDSLIKAIGYAGQKFSVSKPYRDFLFTWLLQNYTHRRFPGSERVYVYLAEQIIKAGDVAGFSEATFQKLQTKIDLMKVTLPGTVPPGLSLPGPDGKVRNISSLNDRYTIVFFFDLNCPACKYASSEITKISSRYGSKRLSVYAVCMSDDRQVWLKYTETANPTWIEVTGAGNANLIRDYQLEYLPVIYLIGKDKKIVAGNLGIPELEKLLQKLYADD